MLCSETASLSPSPLCFCVPVCVVLVAYSENNASPGDRSDALHVLILYYLIQREPLPLHPAHQPPISLAVTSILHTLCTVSFRTHNTLSCS